MTTKPVCGKCKHYEGVTVIERRGRPTLYLHERFCLKYETRLGHNKAFQALRCKLCVQKKRVKAGG
jgi:hypothetical protein